MIDPGDFTSEALAKIAPACAECGQPGSVTMVTGKVIYPHRPDLAGGWYWRCACGAYCGVHMGTMKALGSPAGPETRRAREAAHAAFDPMWRAKMRRDSCTANVARGAGYKWLAAQLGIDRKLCHIAMMDAETARRTVEICKQVMGR